MGNGIKQIVVVGAGQMGHQIAMLCALGGYRTVLQDVNGEALRKAEANLGERMSDWVKKGKLSDSDKETAFALLSYTDSLEEAVRDADLVIEAIVEQLDVKRDLFRELDRLTPARAILATNSSTMVNSLLAEVTGRPEKVCNMHFFFPPLVMECVEIVMSDQTSEETAAAAMAVCERIGRKGILLRKEISGFVANRILGAIQREAIHLYEEGIADFKDIDVIVKKSLGHLLGPFELIDLSGADVVYSAMQHLFSETGNLRDKPPACILEKVRTGELGRKTGVGFYEYRKEEVL
ncbi:3-hydroxyacyl-CoA dehydrogenase family protein [Sporosarcina sp. 179-K 3D1 HS]|uniref:3-hydroxyacyl-CoA dehydrogenase family protein n=1 Tax=Sporosarcina sp. 179-K 3D1 HS TaxID=3232169 RepID=UPI00399F7772